MNPNSAPVRYIERGTDCRATPGESPVCTSPRDDSCTEATGERLADSDAEERR